MEKKFQKSNKVSASFAYWLFFILYTILTAVGYLYFYHHLVQFALVFGLFWCLGAMLLLSNTDSGRQLSSFLSESFSEMKLVEWPSLSDTGTTTAVVVVSVIIASAVLKVIDACISLVLGWILA